MTDPKHEDHELRDMLASLRVDPPDDGFRAELHRRLVAGGVPAAPSVWERLRAFARQRPLLVGLSAGACAGCAVFAALWLAFPRLEPAVARVDGVAKSAAPEAIACAPVEEPSVEVFVVPAGKVAMVQFNFAAPSAVEEAEFSVLLPAALSFFSEGELLPERSFHWIAPLTEGDNRVPFAIVGQAPGKHRVTATATIAGEVVVHTVVLDVQEAS